MEGAKALAEALKLNKNLTDLKLRKVLFDLMKYILLFYQNRKVLAFLILRNNSKNTYL